MTSFIFQRDVKASCQINQLDIVTDGSGQNVIYAFGDSNTFGQHSPLNRGSALIDFSTSAALNVAPARAADALDMTITAPNFTVPSVGVTNYCYRLFRLTAATTFFQVINLTSSPLMSQLSTLRWSTT
jgi:hypothetical protein